jgi:hypothetical protein
VRRLKDLRQSLAVKGSIKSMKCKRCNRDISVLGNATRLDIGVRVVPYNTAKECSKLVVSIDLCDPCSKQELTKIKMNYPGLSEVM